MRILHSSDWHLGHQLMNHDRKEEHQAFLKWLIDIIDEQKVDILLLSGDVFDSCVPPNYAQQMYFDFLSDIQTSYCKNVIITGGNHDSISHLEAPKKILKQYNIHVIGGITQNPDDLVIKIEKNDKLSAIICAVPYLREKDVRISRAGENYEEKHLSYKNGLIQYFNNIYNQAKEISRDENVPIIGMGHLFITGSETSEGERDLFVGGLGEMQIKDFPDFSYIALGHLHKAQKVGGCDTIRYSGSPIPLSFSEAKNQKQIVLLDIDNHFKIQNIPIPIFQTLKTIKGKFDFIINSLMEYPNENNNEKSVWVEIEIDGPRSDFHQSKIEEVISDKSVEILAVKYKKYKYRSSDDENIEIQEFTPKRLFNEYLNQEHIELSDKEKIDLNHAFNEILSTIPS